MQRIIALFLLFFTVGTFASFAQNKTAGVNIPANQTFILGEYMKADYKATLRNDGRQTVQVKLVDKATRETLETITLAPKAKEKVTVDPSREVHLVNRNKGKAKVYVVMSETVPGMRYVDVDAELPPAAPRPAAPAEAEKAPLTCPHETEIVVPAFSTFRFAPDRPTKYAAVIQNKGSRNVNVRIRDRNTDEQTQGFGLGRYGDPVVYLKDSEVLTLVNKGAKAAKLTLKTTVAF